MTQSWDPPAASNSLSSSRAKINTALESLRDNFRGASEPGASIRTPGQCWWDSATERLKIRNEADTGWHVLVPASAAPRQASISHFLNVATVGTERQDVILYVPFAITVVSAFFISPIATSGSDGSNYWTATIKNLTAGNTLASAPWVSNGSELAVNTPKSLALDQNLSVAANAVLVLSLQSTGTPTSLQDRAVRGLLNYIPT